MSAPSSVRSALAPQVQELGAALTHSRYVCFGGFQLDTERELLYKDGSKMRLPGKVFQTLVALVEKPGEVVTREALRERLWPEGTFVNYDANVNNTVNKLRLVLGDSPDQPSFIETIPRLGYCFVGNVQRRNELLRPMAAETPTAVVSSTPQAITASRVLASALEPTRPIAAKPKTPGLWADWRMRGLGALVLLCGMLIGMGIVLLTYRV